MFDTMKVARRIRQARIERNMTQMQLADQLGISYQAVSNWERGNSMPDISKLEELCGILQISIADLLGQDAEQEAQTIQEILEDHDVPTDDLIQVAPVLSPGDISRHIRTHGDAKYGLSSLSALAPFLDEDTLDELAELVEVEDLHQLSDLAPFLSNQTLEKLIRKYKGAVEEMSVLTCLAPFVSEETVDKLAESVEVEDLYQLSDLAPFLSDETMEKLIRKYEGAVEDFFVLSCLAPFLSTEALSSLVDQKLEEGDFSGIECIAPFLSKETLRKAAKRMMEKQKLDDLRQIMPFI